MSEFDKKRLEREFEMFTSQHFEKPRRCKNLDQIRYYIEELSAKVADLKQKFNYVPDNAYTLLEQYNSLQNNMLFKEFKNTY